MTESNTQNRRLGYARVSTYGQTLDAQLDQLRKAGCTKIYREKVTGTRADRRELLKLLKAVVPGDLVTVTCIKAGAGRRHAASIWDDRRGSPRRSRRKRGCGGPRARRSRNWRKATTSEYRRFRGLRSEPLIPECVLIFCMAGFLKAARS